MRRFILTFITILTAIVLVLALLWAVFVAPLAHADTPATFTYIGPGPLTIETTPTGPNWLALAVGWGMVLSGFAILACLFLLILKSRAKAAQITTDRSLIYTGASSVNERRYAGFGESGSFAGFPAPTDDDLQDGGNISSVGILTNFPSTQPEPGNDP